MSSMNLVSQTAGISYEISPIVSIRIGKCYNGSMDSSKDSQTKKIIGKNLRALREKRGLTQEELAEKAEISPAYVVKMEAGKKNPSSIVLKKLAKVLKVKSSDILPF